MKKERVITVRMSPKLHAALKELAHQTRSSLNSLCVATLEDACWANEASKAILDGPEISENPPNQSNEPSVSTTRRFLLPGVQAAMAGKEV